MDFVAMDGIVRRYNPEFTTQEDIPRWLHEQWAELADIVPAEGFDIGFAEWLLSDPEFYAKRLVITLHADHVKGDMVCKVAAAHRFVTPWDQ
jgi:hypothetical protein